MEAHRAAARVLRLAVTIAACRLDTARGVVFEASLNDLVDIALGKVGEEAEPADPPAAEDESEEPPPAKEQPTKLPPRVAGERIGRDGISYDDKVRIRAEYDAHVEKRKAEGHAYAAHGFNDTLVLKYSLRNRAQLKNILNYAEE